MKYKDNVPDFSKLVAPGRFCKLSQNLNSNG